MALENYAKCEFEVYVSIDATAGAASYSTLAVSILTQEDSKPKFWMHIKHCLSSTKAIPFHEVQKLICVDAAAFEDEKYLYLMPV